VLPDKRPAELGTQVTGNLMFGEVTPMFRACVLAAGGSTFVPISRVRTCRARIFAYFRQTNRLAPGLMR